MFTIYNPFSLFLCAFSFCFTENSARIPDVVVQRMCRVYPVNPTLVGGCYSNVRGCWRHHNTQFFVWSGLYRRSQCFSALINRRETEFTQNNPTFDDIYINDINRDGSFMAAAVLSFINITRNLAP